MSINEVIEAGALEEPTLRLFQYYGLSSDNILLAGFIIVMVFALIYSIIKKHEAGYLIDATIIIVALPMLFIMSLEDYKEAQEIYESKLFTWQIDTVPEFIKKLERHQVDIQSYEIIQEDGAYTDWFKNKSTINPFELQYGTFTYDTDKTHTGWFAVKKILPNDITPHAKYSLVEKDLGNGIEKGFYDIILYLPANTTEGDAQ